MVREIREENGDFIATLEFSYLSIEWWICHDIGLKQIGRFFERPATKQEYWDFLTKKVNFGSVA